MLQKIIFLQSENQKSLELMKFLQQDQEKVIEEYSEVQGILVYL